MFLPYISKTQTLRIHLYSRILALPFACRSRLAVGSTRCLSAPVAKGAMRRSRAHPYRFAGKGGRVKMAEDESGGWKG